MTRTTAREIAIVLGFSAAAGGERTEELLERFFDREHYATLGEENEIFSEYPNEKQLCYIRELVQLVAAHREELNAVIEQYAEGWRADRISHVAAAILRSAMCEILYMPDVPEAAAINEAVELAKKYEDAETVSFINGVLGGFVRGRAQKTEEQS